MPASYDADEPMDAGAPYIVDVSNCFLAQKCDHVLMHSLFDMLVESGLPDLATLAESLGERNGHQKDAGPHGGVSSWETARKWCVLRLQTVAK